MPSKPTVTAKMIMEMIEKQQFRCALSGRTLTPESASLDHILPLSRNGVHDITNLWVVDHRVNAAKGTLTLDEFVNLCGDVVSFTKGVQDGTNA